MKLYIYAERDLHDSKPHIFYSEDFSDNDIGNCYEVLKTFFVDWLNENDNPFLDDEMDHFVRRVDGKPAIVIPKGDIITITDIDNGAFEFEVPFNYESDTFRFWVGDKYDTPMYLRCTESELVACDITANESLDTCDKYQVRHFAGEGCGLLDYFSSDNWSDIEEKAHEMISKGGYIELANTESGIMLLMSHDNYFDEFEGEFPIKEEWMY